MYLKKVKLQLKRNQRQQEPRDTIRDIQRFRVLTAEQEYRAQQAGIKKSKEKKKPQVHNVKHDLKPYKKQKN